ncbi:tRNA (N6-isopentenyl adenosine(37)-C2)-methylthiotransferase MiaB [Patescibacteria group bacterium]|nr:tRNA (N6-isopentenyl adenosine(37)-C2)-methylthiotransferase MiaB [Patescibacteria group bacterium]
MKYHIITFGYQFNKSDAEKVTKVLTDYGYQSTDTLDKADVVLVLACSVRQSAIDRIDGLKRKFAKIKKTRPLITILSGCVLKTDMGKMRKFFDVVLDIRDLSKLPEKISGTRLRQDFGGQVSNQGSVSGYFDLHPAYKSNFQAYVPIMTGCDNFCAYCVVPYVRGREQSRKASDIIAECKSLISKGYKEITLLGQNVNSYQGTMYKCQGTMTFSKLLQKIDSIPGRYWLRFMTSHPKDFSDELIDIMSNSKHITPYLHLPIQAGDDQVLKSMNRKYKVGHYKKLVNKVRKAIPNMSLSTDVIVGFPGETKKQFNNTAKVFKDLKFDMAYISQYSQRAGTAAAKLEDNVPKVEKKKRDKILTEILKKTSLEYNKKFIGNVVEVLVEENKNGYNIGRTDTYKTVKLKSNKDLKGKFVRVKIKKGPSAFGLTGELVSD